MLSAQSRPVIEATLPVVGGRIVEIADRFYDRLFEHHPELLDGVFNRGNQASGEQRKSLAGSIAIYATWLVDKPGQSPLSLMGRVAHKHVSLGIRPEQYQVVHDNLFAAIVDVLGEAVTPPVAAAWDEVYWHMARELIAMERGLYSARGLTAATAFRTWKVIEKHAEAEDIVRFLLGRADHRLVKASLPGQYITVQVKLADGTHQPRQYSLTRADDGRTRSFVVKRVRAGNGSAASPAGEVSNWLHDHVQVGDELTTSAPHGDVVLDDSGHPVVFCSAGIGIAPMAGMLSHLASAESDLTVRLLHVDASPHAFALRRQLEDDVGRLRNATLDIFLDGPGAPIPASDEKVRWHRGGVVLAADLPSDGGCYLCGPLAFMQAMRSQLIERGIAAKDIQYEVFGPDLWQADYGG